MVILFGISSAVTQSFNASNKSTEIYISEKSGSTLGEIQFGWSERQSISKRYHKIELMKNGRTFFTKLNTTSDKCE